MTGEKQQLLCPLLSLCMRQRKGGQRGKGRGREESELWEKVQGNAPKTNAMTHLTTRMNMAAAAAEGFGGGERKFLHFLSTLKANFCPGRRDGRKHSCALAALPVSSTNAEQRSHINLKESEICKAVQQQKHLQVEAFLWGSRAQSWPEMMSCPGRPQKGADCSRAETLVLAGSLLKCTQHSLYSRAPFSKDFGKMAGNDTIEIFTATVDRARVAIICCSLSEGDVEQKWQPWWSHFWKITSIPTCTAHFSFLERSLCFFCPEQSQQKALRLMTVKVISEPRRRLTFLHFPTIMKRDKTAN